MSDFLFRMVSRAIGPNSGVKPRPTYEAAWTTRAEPQLPIALEPSDGMVERAMLHGPTRSLDDQFRLERPDSRLPAASQNYFSARALPSPPEPEVPPVADRMLYSPTFEKPARTVAVERMETTQVRTYERDTHVEQHEAEITREAPSVRDQQPAKPERSSALMQPELTRPPTAEREKQNAVSSVPAEPAVEVNIGRVEVRFDAPPQATPSRPPAPHGFGEYTPLRSYSPRAWNRSRA